MKIGVSSLVLDFFLHIFLVKSDNTSLKLFEICDLVKALENIVLEFLLIVLLFIQSLSAVLNIVSKTFLSHSQIINDQSQVLINSIEMLELLSHLVCLLIKLLNLKFSWADITF